MRVDVILPTYQGEAFVAEALESVLAQTHRDWHLTAIDDNSSDATWACLEAFRHSHPDHADRITLLRNDQNIRAAACRMRAIASCDAPLIAFLDQDDLWLPENLERQVAGLEREPSLDALHGDVEHIDVEGRLLEGASAFENERRRRVDFARLDREQTCRALFKRNTIRLASAIVRRDAFIQAGGFRGELFGGEDWEFWVRFASQFRIGHLPEILTKRRIHSGNTSTAQVLARTPGLPQALSILEAEQPSIAHLCADLCAEKRRALEGRLVLESSQAGRYADAAAAAWKLLRITPWRAVNAIYLAIGISGPIGRSLVSLRRSLLVARNTTGR